MLCAARLNSAVQIPQHAFEVTFKQLSDGKYKTARHVRKVWLEGGDERKGKVKEADNQMNKCSSGGRGGRK